MLGCIFCLNEKKVLNDSACFSHKIDKFISTERLQRLLAIDLFDKTIIQSQNFVRDLKCVENKECKSDVVEWYVQ